MDSAPENKSSTTKYLIGCALFLVLLIVAAIVAGTWFFKSITIEDPAKVRELASSIAYEMQIPAEYEGTIGVDVFGHQYAYLTHTDNGLSIGMMRKADGGSIDSKAEISKLYNPDPEAAVELELIETREFDVAGAKVELTCHAGMPQQGEQRMLAWHGLLPTTEEGSVWIGVFGGQEGFDDAAMLAFLAGIPTPE